MTCKKRYDNLSKNRENCFKCSEITTEERKMKVFGKNVVGRMLQQYQKILFHRQSLSFSIRLHGKCFWFALYTEKFDNLTYPNRDISFMSIGNMFLKEIVNVIRKWRTPLVQELKRKGPLCRPEAG